MVSIVPKQEKSDENVAVGANSSTDQAGKAVGTTSPRIVPDTSTPGRVVESVKAKRGPKGNREFLVTWVGGGKESWLNYHQLIAIPNGVQQLQKTARGLVRKTRKREKTLQSVKAIRGPAGSRQFQVSWVGDEKDSWLTYPQLIKLPNGHIELFKMIKRQRAVSSSSSTQKPQGAVNLASLLTKSPTKETIENTCTDQIMNNIPTEGQDIKPSEIEAICEFRATPSDDKYLVSLLNCKTKSWVSPKVIQEYFGHLTKLLKETRELEKSAAEKTKQLELKLRGVEKYRAFLPSNGSTGSSNLSKLMGHQRAKVSSLLSKSLNNGHVSKSAAPLNGRSHRITQDDIILID